MINLKVLPERLNIRNTPKADTEYSNWVGELLKGDHFVAESIVKGEAYNGVDLWYKDNYNRYVTLSELEVDNPAIPWSLRILGVPHIWTTTRGEGVKVAIIDSGVDMKNEDLKGAVLCGYNILTDEKYPNNVASNDSCLQDNYYHGTVCATIIGSRGKNGIIGIAPESSIIAIKISDKGQSSDAIRLKGIKKAVELGAEILSISFGNSDADGEMNTYLKQLMQEGIICIAAAGNNMHYTDYPANYAGMISVGDVGCADQNAPADTAQFHLNGDTATGCPDPENGYEGVTLVAPGENITAYNLTGTPAYQFTGTSFAAPFVAGLAALWLSEIKKKTSPTNSTLNFHNCFRNQIIHSCCTRCISDFDESRCGAGIMDPKFVINP